MHISYRSMHIFGSCASPGSSSYLNFVQVLTHLTGRRQPSAESDAASDLNAMSGVLSITGFPEQPAKVGVPISDLNAGLFASHAILAALLARFHTGEGQYVETSLLEAALAYTIWESKVGAFYTIHPTALL